MNPQFTDGDAHLLHAWEILNHGDTLWLLNELTLNPTTQRRKLLAAIIEKHGMSRPLGCCFVDTQRKNRCTCNLAMLSWRSPAWSRTGKPRMCLGNAHERFSTSLPACKMAQAHGCRMESV